MSTVTAILASAADGAPSPGGPWVAWSCAVATVPTLVIVPSTRFPPGIVTVTFPPAVASAWSATLRATVTSRVVPVYDSTVAPPSPRPAGAPTRAVWAATRTGPGVNTTCPGSTVPVEGRPRLVCQARTAAAVPAV